MNSGDISVSALTASLEIWKRSWKFLNAKELITGSSVGWGGRVLLTKEYNWKKGVEMMKSCSEDEAVWFCSLLGQEVLGPEKAAEIFLATAEKTTDLVERSRAYLYAGTIYKDSIELIQKASNLGNDTAQLILANYLDNIDLYAIAAAQGNRIALKCIAELKEPVDLKSLEASAKLGYAESMVSYSREFNFDDPRKYIWLGEAIKQVEMTDRYGHWKYLPVTHFIGKLSMMGVESKKADFMNRKLKKRDWPKIVLGNQEKRAVYWAGKYLVGAINTMEDTIFGVPFWRLWHAENSKTNRVLAAARDHVKFYENSLLSARKAVDAWFICGRRLGLYRDIIRVIARKVWNLRDIWL